MQSLEVLKTHRSRDFDSNIGLVLFRYYFGLVAGNLILLHENSKGADRPVHLHRLINTSVIHFSRQYNSLLCFMQNFNIFIQYLMYHYAGP